MSGGVVGTSAMPVRCAGGVGKMVRVGSGSGEAKGPTATLRGSPHRDAGSTAALVLGKVGGVHSELRPRRLTTQSGAMRVYPENIALAMETVREAVSTHHDCRKTDVGAALRIPLQW